MERKSLAPTLLDGQLADLGGRRSAAFFQQCNAIIPWDQLAAPLAGMYTNDTARGGRPNWPLTVMLKCIMLQKWFGLSDPMLEEMVRDRISFRRFLGLSFYDATPDETTLVTFRKRLRTHGHGGTLFDTTLAILRHRGVVLETGTLVDATIIEAPRGRTTKDGLDHSKDPSASYTKKHGRTYHGFKGHIATDPHGIVKDYRYDTASVHDSQHFDSLTAEETEAVYGDSAFMKAERKEALAKREVFCGIVERRVRGQSDLTAAQKQHNRFVAGIRATVEHPFAWMKAAGAGVARYRGIARNAMDFCLHCIAYNWRRSFSLLPAAG